MKDSTRHGLVVPGGGPATFIDFVPARVLPGGGGTLPTVTADPRDLETRYAAAATEVSSLPVDADPSARRLAVVRAIWRHLAPTGVSWVGFYVAQAGNPVTELLLDCREPKPACSPIGMHGVCGQSFLGRTVRIVEDTRDLGAAYVACDPRDRSEIVLPIAFADGLPAGSPTGVLDLDSHDPGRFGPADERGLRAVLEAAGIRVATGS